MKIILTALFLYISFQAAFAIPLILKGSKHNEPFAVGFKYWGFPEYRVNPDDDFYDKKIAVITIGERQ